MRVDRGRGWPSADHDLLHVADLAHPLMPVGFYLKTFIRPRFAWRDGRARDPARDGFGAAAPGCARRAHGRPVRPMRDDRGRRRHRRTDRRARGRRGWRTRAPVRRVRDRLPARAGSDAGRGPGARDARPGDPGDRDPRAACRARPVRRPDACPSRLGRARAGARRPRRGRDRCHRVPPALPRQRPPRRVARSRRVGDGGAARRPAWPARGRRGVDDRGRGASAGARRGGDPGRRRARAGGASWTRCRTRPRRSWTASSSRRAATGACAR